jgi:hypothetical protein
MAALTTQDGTPHAGVAIDFTATASSGSVDGNGVITNGDTAEVGDRLYLYVRNNGGSPTTLEIETTGQVSGLLVQNRIQSVAAGAIRRFPLPADLYRRAATGRAHFFCNPTTSVVLAVVRG